MLLFRDDVPVRSTLSLFLDNVRMGDALLPDLHTIHSALVVGDQLLRETAERYGPAALLGAARYVCDASAEAVRCALEAYPDGEYVAEDVLDCDGQDDSVSYRIVTTVRKVGGRAEIDFSGTSEEARTSLNAAWPDLKSCVAFGLMYLLTPHDRFTSGILRHVDILAPGGTIINAIPPAPIMIYWEANFAVGRTLFKALGAALGARGIAGDSNTPAHFAFGVRDDGSPWMEAASCGGSTGPWGATDAGDGENTQPNYFSNYTRHPVESVESNSPLLLLRHEYVPDTGGCGEHRGGVASAKDSLWLTDASAAAFSIHEKSRAGHGAFGGSDGNPGGVWLWRKPDLGAHPFLLPLGDDECRTSTPVAGTLDPDSLTPDAEGTYFYFGREKVWQTAPGAIWRYLVQGGGGWGDPLQRDPAAVLRDVRDGYVSVAGAQSDYGVVVTGDPDTDPEGIAVDEAATTELRAERRNGRNTAPSPPRTAAVAEVNSTFAPPRILHREAVESRCDVCDSDDIARYPVLSEGGWWLVVKCQRCLVTLERSRWSRLGDVRLLSDSETTARN